MRRPPRFYRQGSVWGGLLASLLIHLLALFLAREFWMEEIAPRTFRARLAQVRPRFEPRRLTSGKRIEMPSSEMERLSSPSGPREIPESGLALSPAPAGRIGIPEAPLALREIASGAKEEEPLLAREKMLSPAELGLADSAGIPSMDLLRISDMARADKERALVMIDKSSRRDLLGYVNFTRLRVYGAGSGGGEDSSCFRNGLEPLARYLRDYTHLLAQVREKSYEYFLSEDLLEDPIHFLFQDCGLHAYQDGRFAYFSPEEKRLLARYLRGGGFLYVEGDNRFLREMAGQLRRVLDGKGRLFPLPVTHPIYHAFYDFDSGFPGEKKNERTRVSLGGDWSYPAQPLRTGTPIPRVTFFDPQEVLQEEAPSPLGLWGVEVEGDLVAVLSDVDLSVEWSRSFSDTRRSTAYLPALMAGTNIVVYALTRPSGLTPKEPRPVWMSRPRPAAVAGGEEREEAVDQELLESLDASLAFLQVPLGRGIERGGFQVRLDGRYSVELVRKGLHGLLLHNLPAGRHWIELQYGGKRKQIEIELQGGKVATVTFGLNRFAFLSQLHLNQQEPQVGLEQWRRSFSDLEVEEIYLDEERSLLEPPGGL